MSLTYSTGPVQPKRFGEVQQCAVVAVGRGQGEKSGGHQKPEKTAEAVHRGYGEESAGAISGDIQGLHRAVAQESKRPDEGNKQNHGKNIRKEIQ